MLIPSSYACCSSASSPHHHDELQEQQRREPLRELMLPARDEEKAGDPSCEGPEWHRCERPDFVVEAKVPLALPRLEAVTQNRLEDAGDEEGEDVQYSETGDLRADVAPLHGGGGEDRRDTDRNSGAIRPGEVPRCGQQSPESCASDKTGHDDACARLSCDRG